MPKSTRRQWKASQKLAIVSDYEQRKANGESSRSIARRHGIQSIQLQGWVKKKAQLQSTLSSRKRVGRVGRLSSIHHLEEELMSWVFELRDNNIPVHYQQVMLKASTIDHEFAQKSVQAKYNVVRRVCRANELVLRRGTTVSQVNPQEKRTLQLLLWLQYAPFFKLPVFWIPTL
jgi:transposase-like protein